MARGIIIFGSAGSGKTTLGKLVAKKLNFPYFDIDDYIWRKDTEIPFTVMYTYEEKVNRLMTDILKGTNFFDRGNAFSLKFTKGLETLIGMCFIASIGVILLFYYLRTYGGPGPLLSLVMMGVIFLIWIVAAVMMLIIGIMKKV